MAITSFAYADESGDTGYKFDKGSSPKFVMGVIIPEQPEQIIDRILAIRRELGKSATYEFHFWQADPKTRTRFFEGMQEEPGKILMAVLRKRFAPR